VRTLLKLGVAAAIVVATYFAVHRIAEEKASTLAGGGTFTLDRQHPEEWRAFGLLREHLREWGETDLATALLRLQEKGDLWVAPELGGNRSAIYVNALDLVTRVFVRRDELLARELPFPELDIPESAQRTFATIRLAGTLFHELQHYDGLEDEDATYAREIEWYEELRERRLDRLAGEPRRLFEWAVDSAIATATAARDKAEGSGLEL
jgi:hypothetical protein